MRKKMSLILVLVCISFFCIDAYSGSKLESVGLSLAEESRKEVLINEELDSYPTLRIEDVGEKPMDNSPMRVQGPMKIGPTGSTIVGWRSFNEPKGWFELSTDGTETMLWQNFDLEPAAGFVKDGKLYSYYAKNSFGSLYMSYFINDLVTGETLESGSFDSSDASRFVLIATYDSAQDLVYAYTYSADGATNWIQTIDPDTREFTKLCEPSAAPRLISYNPVDGKIYGISKTGEFISLDATTGNMEVIGHTGFTPSVYKQTMTFSPIDKKFIWAALMEDLTACVIAVDPATGKGEKIADLPLWTEYNILDTTDEMPNPSMPLAPQIVSKDFVNEALYGSVTVKMPEKTYSGEDFLNPVKLIVSLDDKEYASFETLNPGEEQKVDFSDLAQGNHKFSFKVVEEIAGGVGLESPMVSTTFYVGYDIPLAPTNVLLEPTLISWDPVVEGVNGGYIDVDNVTYDVYLNYTKMNASPIVGTSFEINLPGGDLKSYSAYVVAQCHGMISEGGNSNVVIYGDAYELPITFQPTVDEVSLFSVLNVNEDNFTWKYDPVKQAFYYDYTSAPADDWLFLPVINFRNADCSYNISVDAWVKSRNFPESFKLAYGTSPDPSAMTTIASFDKITNEESVQYSGMFNVPVAGLYYIGIYACSDAYMYELFVNNIQISEVQSDSPQTVSELVVEVADKGALNAIVSFVMPTNKISGELIDADADLKAVISSSVDTVEITAKPGEVVSELSVETIQGKNEITVVVYDGEFASTKQSVNIFTGLAVPSTITKLTAVVSEDNLSAHISWTAPTYGITEGYFNSEDVKYYYCEYYDGIGWMELSELGNVCEFDIEVDKDSSLQPKYIGIRTAIGEFKNAEISYMTIVMGTPYQAPMEETFVNGTYAYSPVLILKPNTYYNAHCNLGNPKDRLADCVSSDECALISYTSDIYYDSFGKISLPKFSTVGVENPKFSVRAWISENTAQTEIYASASNIGETLIGSFGEEAVNEWRDIEIFLPEEFKERGWVEITIKSYYYKAVKYSIIDGYSFYGDNTKLVEPVVVDDLNAIFVAETPAVELSWTNPDIETEGMQLIGYDIYRNDLLIAQEAAPTGSYIDAAIEANSGDYTYHIVAVTDLDGEKIYHAKSNKVSVSTSSISDMANEIVVVAYKGMVYIYGAVGKVASVYVADGRLIHTHDVKNDIEQIAMQPGIYIIKLDDEVKKVIVK